MATQRGAAKSGLTGMFSFPHLGNAGLKFALEIMLWKVNQDGQTKPRWGRGSTGFFKKLRYLATGGGGSARGLELGTGWPSPVSWEGAEGSIRIDFNKTKGQYATYPIKVIGFGHQFDVNRDDEPSQMLTFAFTGLPTFYGWPGSQPTADAISKSDQQQADGTFFAIDGSNIASSGKLVIDWWDDSVGNSNDAEIAKLAAVVAAAIIPANFKPKVPSITRDGPDGGTVTIPLSLTTTAEDWVNEHTAFKIDPKAIATGGPVAAINATPILPTVAGQTVVNRGTTSIPINSSTTGYVTETGERSTDEDIEMDESSIRIDKQGIDGGGQDVDVYLSAGPEPADAVAPDASLKAVGISLQEVNEDSYKKITFFRANSSIEQILYARERAITDPSSIKNETIVGAVYPRDDEPSAPDDVPDALVLNHIEYFEVTSPDTSNLRGKLWFYGEKTSADDVIFERTKLDHDSTGIDSNAITGAIITTGASLVVPSVPFTGVKFIGYIDAPETNASASNKSLRLYKWGTRDSGEERGFARAHIEIDSNHIDDSAITYAIWNTGNTPPAAADNMPAVLGGITANVKLIDSDDHPLVNISATTYLRWFLWGAKDSRDEQVIPETETVVDASTLKLNSSGKAAYLDGESAPSTPSGLKVTLTKTRPITIGLTTNRTLTVLIYGLATAQDSKETEKVETTIDGGASPLYLSDKAVRTKLWLASGSPPAAPDDVPTNNVKVDYQDDLGVPENPLLKLRVWVYGPQNSADKLVLGSPALRHRYETVTDVSSLECTAIRACLTNDGSDTTPTTVTDANGNVLVKSKRYVQPQSIGLSIQNPVLTIWEYALATPAQMRTFRESKAISGPLDVYVRRDASIVTIASTLSTDAATDAIYVANQSNAAINQAEGERLTPTQLLQIIESTGEDGKQHSGGEPDSRDWNFRGKPAAGWNNPTAFGDPNSYIFVRLAGAVSGGGGLLSGFVQAQFWRRNRGSFKIRRRILATSPADPFLPQRGTVNDSPFRGYPAHQVMYTGAQILWNEHVSGGHLLVADLCFDTDDLMFMNDGLLPDPNNKVYVANTLSPLTASGFYDPAIFNSTSGVFIIQWPNVSAFNSFGVAV